MYGCESWTIKKTECQRIDAFELWCWRRLFRESLGLQRDPTSPSLSRSVLGVHWKDWCWSWNSSTLATWCEELTHWKRLWCWERLKAGGEEDDRGWDGWMASLTQWTWVWVNSRSWWWTGRPGMLWFMGRKELDVTGWLNWTEVLIFLTVTMVAWIYTYIKIYQILYFRKTDHKGNTGLYHIISFTLVD